MNFRLGIGLLALFVISAVYSCNEARYLAWGKTADAKIEKVEPVTKHGRYGRQYQVLRFSYSFPDGDLGTRREEDDVAMDFIAPESLPDDGTIPVQYIPGTADRSRLSGHSAKWLIIPFVASLGLLTFFGIRFWREHSDHERRSKAASDLYKR